MRARLALKAMLAATLAAPVGSPATRAEAEQRGGRWTKASVSGAGRCPGAAPRLVGMRYKRRQRRTARVDLAGAGAVPRAMVGPG